MLNNFSRMWLAAGIWLAAVAGVMSFSVAMGASLLTSALLLVMCGVPIGVPLLIGLGAPSPTVAELLYAVNTQKSGRS